MTSATAAETQLAEDVIGVLDFVGRLIQGVDEGNWYYAADKTHQLAGAVARLQTHLDAQTDRPYRAARQGVRARQAAVAAGIRASAHFHRVARLLYPEPAATTKSTPPQEGPSA